MRRRLLSLGFLVAATWSLVSAPVATATTIVAVRASLPAILAPGAPIVRLHFPTPTSASQLPALRLHPILATQWRQVGPRDVEAVATGSLLPSTAYVIALPAQLACATTCTFRQLRAHDTTSATDPTWADELLATLHYLPLTFTTATPAALVDAPQEGAFSWSFPGLPAALRDQWVVGTVNPLLTGALMAFQNETHLPTTGVADAATWQALVSAARAGATDPSTYNYVDVTETLPETATLYVNGKDVFHTLANTGIAPVPTKLGTYPVYARFTSTTMKGTNPDGTTYDDPDIQWVSYFDGGDALHEYPRATYGWPQSLGCVEMPMAAAQHLFPYTPIGTLVTVRA